MKSAAEMESNEKNVRTFFSAYYVIFHIFQQLTTIHSTDFGTCFIYFFIFLVISFAFRSLAATRFFLCTRRRRAPRASAVVHLGHSNLSNQLAAALRLAVCATLRHRNRISPHDRVVEIAWTRNPLPPRTHTHVVPLFIYIETCRHACACVRVCECVAECIDI